MNDVIFGGITVGDLLGILGGGLGVSVVAQLIKRVFKLSSAKVVHLMVITLTVAGTVLADAINVIHGNAAVLGSRATELLGVATAAHTFIVSDADQFLQKVRKALTDENASQAAPAVPPATSTASVAAETPAAPATPPKASF